MQVRESQVQVRLGETDWEMSVSRACCELNSCEGDTMIVWQASTACRKQNNLGDGEKSESEGGRPEARREGVSDGISV